MAVYIFQHIQIESDIVAIAKLLFGLF